MLLSLPAFIDSVFVRVSACAQDLREVFEAEAQQTGRRRLLVTMAAAGGSYFINVAYEPRKIIEYVFNCNCRRKHNEQFLAPSAQ